LFADSDLVVAGKVLGLNSQWGRGNQSSIITVVKFEVSGVAKGEVSTEGVIEVSIPGGKIGEVVVWWRTSHVHTR